MGRVFSGPVVLNLAQATGAALLAFAVAHIGGKYYLEIMLPGSLVGLLTGYATIRYGRGASMHPAPGSGAH